MSAYIRPVGNARISDSFDGHRRRNPPSTEPGTDYAVGRGTPLRAPANGTIRVVKNTTSGAMGRRLTIQFDDGNWGSGIHLASINVSVGQRVQQGQIIAYTGGSAYGSETGVGYHLHWTWWPNRGNAAPTPGSTPPSDFEAFMNGAGQWPAFALYGEAHVKEGQRLLLLLGYNLGASQVDGRDGPLTRNAVTDFQSKNGIQVDGVLGPQTLAALKAKVAGTPAGGGSGTPQGNITSRPTKDIQNFLISKGYDLGPWGADGEYGEKTTAAVKLYQASVGLYADGIWGPQTDGVAFGASQSPDPTLPIAVDGEWGPATTKALQSNIGVTVDGEMGPETVKALQRKTGAVVDGVMGPSTVRHLQKNLGVAEDGEVGPITVKALQAFLNARGVFRVVVVEPAKPPVVYPQPAAPTYPDATRWAHSSNSSPREGTVEYAVIHHAAAKGAEALWKRFNSVNDRSVSPNWLITATGEAWEVVPPKDFRAWTTGAFDHGAITFETENTTLDPEWGVSEASMRRIAEVLAWAAQPTTFDLILDRAHVLGHREVPGQATACPGPTMFPQLDTIVDWAIDIYLEKYAPKPPEPPKDYIVPKALGDQIKELVDQAFTVA